MASTIPFAVYGLDVQPGDALTPALSDFPAAFRITMAAIDPTEHEMPTIDDPLPMSTLKIIRVPPESNDKDLDSDDEDQIRDLIRGAGDVEDSSDDEDEDKEDNAGPSDPSKSLKLRKEQAAAELKKALEAEDVDMDDGLNVPNGVNGKPSAKARGKARASDFDADSDEEDGSLDMEEFVLCTLDTIRNPQQPLNITVGEDERVFFKVSGTHTVYLTGNYVAPGQGSARRALDYDSDDYDDDVMMDEESDELDDISDPRITELSTDDEDEPQPSIKQSQSSKPTKAESTKGSKKKREAEAEADEDEPSNLDEQKAKSLKGSDAAQNGEPKLSKKQRKKLKNNAGRAVDASAQPEANKGGQSSDSGAPGGKGDKKVQFAKDLETGATGSAAKTKALTKAEKKDDKTKSLELRKVQGVTILDQKVGQGPTAKNGDRVSVRYVGKLAANGRVFDSNKKGAPFRFKVGSNQVIKGWDIGVRGMAVGGERKVTIPPQLAYGDRAEGSIPRNSTLTFDIKLISIGD